MMVIWHSQSHCSNCMVTSFESKLSLVVGIFENSKELIEQNKCKQTNKKKPRCNLMPLKSETIMHTTKQDWWTSTALDTPQTMKVQSQFSGVFPCYACYEQGISICNSSPQGLIICPQLLYCRLNIPPMSGNERQIHNLRDVDHSKLAQHKHFQH